MLGAALCFALMAICAKSVSKTIPVGEVVFARNAVLALVLLVVARARGRGELTGRNRPLLLVRGLVGIASIFAYFWAIFRLKTGDAVLMQNTSPILVALFAPLALGERPGRAVWIALGLGFLGVLVVERGASAFGGAAAAPPPIDGLAAGLVSPLLAAAAYLSVRRLARTDPPLTIVLWFGVIGALASAATLPFAFRVPAPLELAPLLGVAAFGGMAQILMTGAYAVGEAADVSVFAYAQPLFAYALGQLVLGESPGWQGVAGAALLIAAGVVVSARR